VKLTLTATIGIATIALLVISVSAHRRDDQPDATADTQTPPPRKAASAPVRGTPSARSGSPVDPGQLEQLLPFTRNQITDAAELARRFTAAYATYRYDESPEQYLQQLTPMMSPQLRAPIWLTATDPTLRAQRQRTQAVTTGQVRLETIRSLGPSSIIFEVTAFQRTTTFRATGTETTHYSLTVIRHDNRWLVYAIELTTTGDNGDQS
jgi:hypothetical protein